MLKDKLSIIKEHMNKLHMKLIVFFLLLVCTIMLVHTYRYNTLNDIVKKSQASYVSSKKIVDVREKVDLIKNSFENYLSSKNKKDIETFSIQKKALIKSLDVLKLNEKYSEKNIKQVNLYHMTSQYVSLLATMVDDSKKITNANVKEANKLYMYIQEYSNEIMGEMLVVDTKEYDDIRKQIDYVNIWSNVISVMVLILAVTCIVVFSVYITRPIKKLSDKTITVSEGNYNLIVNDDDLTGEVKELYDNFNIMTRNIREDVDDIKRARVLEQALARDKITNLNMYNALKEAEYNALSSQVNPHFIFNTINIGSQLAMLNEDNITCEYLQNAARFFRYNLNGLNYSVGLNNELDNVGCYISIMQTRYGDNIEYDVGIGPEMDISIIMLPKMSLQPLVEFLYINSVNSLTEGGMVKILVNQTDTQYIIDILSSGNEIEHATINNIMCEEIEDERNAKNSMDSNNSIEDKEYYMSVQGVRNSIKRLRLLYERKDVVVIKREEDINYITIKIPKDVQIDKV